MLLACLSVCVRWSAASNRASSSANRLRCSMASTYINNKYVSIYMYLYTHICSACLPLGLREVERGLEPRKQQREQIETQHGHLQGKQINRSHTHTHTHTYTDREQHRRHRHTHTTRRGRSSQKQKKGWAAVADASSSKG